jgi:signal transduction histidine kinase
MRQFVRALNMTNDSPKTSLLVSVNCAFTIARNNHAIRTGYPQFPLMPPRILIVEDELIVALELQDRLLRQGYTIAGIARSADEALAIVGAQALAELPVDLALLDLRLAGARDGVDLANDLLAHAIPFVFLTAHGDDETLARVRSVEPLGYLLKPFEERLLHLTIETALQRHAGERARLAAVEAQRRAEQQLVRARELEVVGRVASGVAHDLNNLLSVVWMTSYLLRHASEHQVAELLEDLDSAVQLGASLTARLLAMARRRGSETRVVAINEALETIAKLARRACNNQVRVLVELDPEAGAIAIDPAQLDQLVLNLVINADRAMPEGGRLSLRSRAVSSAEGAWVIVEVEDTGVGIDASIRDQLFEPFVSTRARTGGTGLGLSIVADVVEQAGGILEFETELGRGTVFRIRFPRVGDSPRSPATEPPVAGRIAGQGRRILVVDDEGLHRRSLARLLAAQGFCPLEAQGAGEAMLMVERGEVPLALALVDIELPYMDGRELSDRIGRSDRSLPVVLMTGSMAALTGGTATPDRILAKPIEPEALFALLARLLPESEVQRP